MLSLDHLKEEGLILIPLGEVCAIFLLLLLS